MQQNSFSETIIDKIGEIDRELEKYQREDQDSDDF